MDEVFVSQTAKNHTKAIHIPRLKFLQEMGVFKQQRKVHNTMTYANFVSMVVKRGAK